MWPFLFTILDFAGPSEVFASTEGFNVYTVSLTNEPLVSQGFIKIMPTYSLSDCPKPDIVVLPGAIPDRLSRISH